MCDSVLDQELDFTMDIKVRDNLTDQKLPDDIGTQMVFMSQREGRPDHILSYLVSVPNLHLYWLKMERKGCYCIGQQMNSQILNR